MVPTAKALLGEEAYFYGTAVEGKTPFQLLRLGISEQVAEPVYHGILEILPSDMADVTMFGKSVVLPNIRNLGPLIESSATYRTVQPMGVEVEEMLSRPFIATSEQIGESISTLKGGLGFLYQTSEAPQIFREDILGVAGTLKDIYAGYIRRPVTGLEEAYSTAKGGISFVTQAPSETKDLLGDIWTGYVKRPISTISEYGKEASYLAKVQAARGAYAAEQFGRQVSESLLPFREIGATAKAAVQPVLVEPLREVRAAAKVGMGSLRYWTPIGVEMLKVGVTDWLRQSWLLPSKTTVATTRRLMKPFTYEQPKTVFAPAILEQPKTLKTGIVGLSQITGMYPVSVQAGEESRQREVVPSLVQYMSQPYPFRFGATRARQEEEEEYVPLHYPTEALGVSRLFRVDVGAKPTVTPADIAAVSIRADISPIESSIVSPSVTQDIAQVHAQQVQQIQRQAQEAQQRQDQRMLELLSLKLPTRRYKKPNRAKREEWYRRITPVPTPAVMRRRLLGQPSKRKKSRLKVI